MLAAVIIVIKGFVIWYYCSEATKMRHNPIDCQRPNISKNYIRSNDGLYFYYKSWVPPHPKALIFIIHGLGEHIDRPGYDYLAKKFYSLGYAVFGHDHEGHGRSSGTKTFVSGFDQYCQHAFNVIQHISNDYKGLPIYGFGHSMGGLITLLMTIHYPDLFNGVMLSAPLLVHPAPGASKVLHFFGRLLPKLPLFIASIDLTTLTRNESAKQAYINDELVYHGRLRFQFLAALDRAVTEVHARVDEIKTPLIIVHSESDRIVRMRGSEELIENMRFEDKKFVGLKDMYHEFFEDEERDSIIQIYEDWVEGKYERNKKGMIENVHLDEDE